MTTKSEMRCLVLALRRRLPKAVQIEASQRFAEQFSQTPLFQQSQRIAFYLPFDGELDPRFLYKKGQHKEWFLPVLSLARSMAFYSYNEGALLNRNQYGILEPNPKNAEMCPSENLDLVLVPLVAFDDQNNRLGMGGGYYDRSFAFLKNYKKEKQYLIKKPYLLGLAYSLQKQKKIPVDSWDIPIDEVWVVDVGSIPT